MFLSFTRLALQGFGGVLSVAQRELVEKRHWLTSDQFVEDWAVAQILPGPNVVNLSIIIGGRFFGLTGAFAALAGMLAAPLAIVLLIAAFYGSVANTDIAKGALRGMGAVSAGLITATGIRLIMALDRNTLSVGACFGSTILTFVAVALLHLPLLWILLIIGGGNSLWAYYVFRRLGVRKR